MAMLTQEQESLLLYVNDCLARIAVCAENTAGFISEAQWADAFHGLTRESTWLKDKTFSPGRWAIGYQYLCALYTFLDEMKPKCILDLGLGQSTRMIAQYVAANPEARHIVVESSLEWIEFFKNSGFVLPPNTRIVHCAYGLETFNGVESVRVYENFCSSLQGCKFDFVSIDAPLSGDMREFGRVDTVKLIPDGLSNRYAILFDDTGRKPDNAGFRALVDALTANGFSAKVGCFHGLKWCSAVVSEDLQCLLSNASRRFDLGNPGWKMDFADLASGSGSLDMASLARIRVKGGGAATAMKEAIAKRDKWLSEPLEKREALSKKNAELRAALEKVRSDRDEAQQRVVAMRDARDAALSELVQMRVSRDGAQSQVVAMRDARDSAEGQLAQMRASRDDARQKVVAMRMARDNAQKQLLQMRQARDEAWATVRYLKDIERQLKRIVNQ